MTPKGSGSFSTEDQDTESPLLGVRRSKKTVTESGSVNTEDQETESPRVMQSKKAASLNDTTSELNSKSVAKETDAKSQDGDDEQGPEPKEVDTLETEAKKTTEIRGCGVILKR